MAGHERCSDFSIVRPMNYGQPMLFGQLYLSPSSFASIVYTVFLDVYI